MTAQPDDAAADYRELNFLSLGQAAISVVLKLETRELGVGVDERGDAERERNNQDESQVANHVVAPVELASTFTAAEKLAPAEGGFSSCERRAVWGVLIVTRPMRIRFERWSVHDSAGLTSGAEMRTED